MWHWVGSANCQCEGTEYDVQTAEPANMVPLQCVIFTPAEKAEEYKAPQANCIITRRSAELSNIFNVGSISSHLGRSIGPSYPDFSSINFPAEYHDQKKRLWVYNVSRVNHTVDHPVFKSVTFTANNTKKKYALCMSFPTVLMLPQQQDLCSDQGFGAAATSGEYVVKDLLYPDRWAASIGRDMTVKGVFWSRNNPPLREEIAIAIGKMEAYYKDLLEKIHIQYENGIINEIKVVALMAEKKIGLEEAIRVLKVEKVTPYLTPEHHAAADWFEVTTPWHPAVLKKKK
jgi:hypothetical protein